MEPSQKRIKITDHFRVALRPQDINVKRSFKKLKKQLGPLVNKENVEVITISDDEEDGENCIKRKQPQPQQQNNSRLPPTHLVDHDDQQQQQPSHFLGQDLNETLEDDDNNNRLKEQEEEEEEENVIKHGGEQEVAEEDVDQEHEQEEDDVEEEYLIVTSPTRYRNPYCPPPGLDSNIVDHDELLLNDIYCEPYYAWDSFNYERQQELKFRNRRYMDITATTTSLHTSSRQILQSQQLNNQQDNHQHHSTTTTTLSSTNHHNDTQKPITPYIRARLVDWLVQIQDIFSLYHETLYMAVKIADQYLMRKQVSRQNLQLLYMTSILISAKFDERLPPVEIADLIQQSGGIYSRKQMISFEIDILSTLDFNIRFPLSYGFLRRYARCTRSDQKTLTLARYILESSLLDYEMIEYLESKIAAASLLLAYEMLNIDDAWSETAEFYTGYKQEELLPLLTKLNSMIARPTDRKTSTIRNKYSHEVFLSVARIPPLERS